MVVEFQNPVISVKRGTFFTAENAENAEDLILITTRALRLIFYGSSNIEWQILDGINRIYGIIRATLILSILFIRSINSNVVIK